MKKFLLAILICLFSLSLYSCNDSEIKVEDIKFIEIREGSFKSAYAVDEKIDFSNVFIVISLRDNKGELVEKVLPEMLDGYDVSTTTHPTETRAMRVRYKGIYTSYWNYIVTSETTINTKARLRMSKETVNNQMNVSVRIELDDLSQVKAMLMEVSFDTTRLSYTELETKNEGWTAERRSKSSGIFNLLYSITPGAQSIVNDGEVFVLVFDIESEGMANVIIKNITLSDGESDVNLPSVELR